MRQWRIMRSVRRLIFLNKLRAVLSIGGIAIGIAAVMVSVAVGEGTRESLLTQMRATGSNVITVAAGSFREVFGRRMQTRNVTTLKESDAKAIAEGCTDVSLVAPMQQQMALARYRGGSTSSRVIGTTLGYRIIRNFTIASGRFFTEDDNERSKRVAVLGNKVAAALFGNTDPLEKIIRVNGVPFTVVGTLQPKGISYDGANEDDIILVPLRAAMDRVLNVNYIGYIYVQVRSADTMVRVEREVRNLLRERHKLNLLDKNDDFTIQNVYTALQAATDADAALSRLIMAVAAIALAVGGAGILATMLLSVKERSAEIGLRMAVGARTSDVLLQFLLEASALSVAGGVAGIVAGIVAVVLLRTLAGVNATVSGSAMMISAGVSLAIGVLSGSFPAWKASRVEPAETLKG